MSSLIERPATIREVPRRLQVSQLDENRRIFLTEGLTGVCREFGYATELTLCGRLRSRCVCR